jgi:Ca2+-binding RTX toxin-like protein
LAIDTFKQFFPNIDPFAGSRLRAHASANVMGETITDYFNGVDTTSEDYYILAANEWVATDRLNANTGNNFTSWAEEFGPVSEDGDQFTTTVRLANPILSLEALVDNTFAIATI